MGNYSLKQANELTSRLLKINNAIRVRIANYTWYIRLDLWQRICFVWPDKSSDDFMLFDAPVWIVDDANAHVISIYNDDTGQVAPVDDAIFAGLL